MSDALNNERRWVCVHSETSQPCAEVTAHVGCGYPDAAPVPSPVPSDDHADWWCHHTVGSYACTADEPQCPTATCNGCPDPEQCEAIRPVPSPVPSRPDTALLRAWADEIDASYGHVMLMPQEVVLRQAADWIDAQPAADQGPDLSELRAKREAFGDRNRGMDVALAWDVIDAVDRLLDREGGTQ